MLRNSYKTKQKELILDIIKNHNNHFTIKEIYQELNEEIGLTTIYRLIDKLVEEGLINKEIYDNVTYYQYLEKCTEDNHFYLKCYNCGLLIHIDCDCIKELTDHISKEHNFIPNKEHIIINGLCSKCKENLNER